MPRVEAEKIFREIAREVLLKRSNREVSLAARHWEGVLDDLRQGGALGAPQSITFYPGSKPDPLPAKTIDPEEVRRKDILFNLTFTEYGGAKTRVR